MTVVHETPRRAATPPASRDGGIDLVRAACVVVVVLLHAVMVGVTVDASGPQFVNAADGSSWFTPLTWFAQVMPLFFVIGGFAGALAYRRQRERGGTAVRFVSARVQRLVVPAILVVSVVGVALLALLVAGVPADIVQTAGYRFSQPLWFLAVFLLCQALLPALLALHERAPWRTLAVLATGAVLVDVVRAISGIDAVGILNLLFVWLAVQQIGFFLADGRIDALTRRLRLLVGGGAVVALAAAFLTGVYSPDLYENLNPPTLVLVLVGVAQTMALSLLRRPLERLSRRPRVAAFSGFVNARSMTIYLWHMPVLLALAGAAVVLAFDGALTLPEPSSVEWWLGRPLWFALALALTAAVAVVLGGVEGRRMLSPAASASRTVQAVLAGAGGVVLLLVAGTSPLTAAVAIALMWIALRRLRSGQPAAIAS